MSEEHAARTHRRAEEPLAHYPGPDGRRRVIPTAGRNRQSSREAQLPGDVLTQSPALLRSFVNLGHPRARDLEGLQDLLRPVAMTHVEQERSCGVGGIGSLLAGEEEPHVVLGEEDACDTGEVLRLL